MGNKTVIYKQKARDNLDESFRHLQRLKDAIGALEKKYTFPLSRISFESIAQSLEDIAFSDQIIYRFSKLQDCMGAKLFKSILLYQGENVNKPFLDILNQLETIDIINVDEWFEIRDLRNAIAHDYEDHDEAAINILNAIYTMKTKLSNILHHIQDLIQ